MIDLVQAIEFDAEAGEFGKTFWIEGCIKIVADKFEVWIFEQVVDIGFLRGDKVVDANHARMLEQFFAQEGSDETGTAGDKNTTHDGDPLPID
jgi:hypothetical protein